MQGSTASYLHGQNEYLIKFLAWNKPLLESNFDISVPMRATRAGGWGRGLPCPFLKIKKKCPDFRKKGPDCVHPYVKFILRVSKRSKFKIFSSGAFFSAGLLDEMFIGVPKSHETSLAPKNFWLRAWSPY